MREAEFIAAIQKGDAEVAKTLLAAEPALSGARNANGVSARRLARYSNLKAVSEGIRECRPELDAFEAATCGEVARLRARLDREASLLNARPGDGATALHFSCFLAQPECAREL